MAETIDCRQSIGNQKATPLRRNESQVAKAAWILDGKHEN
jgi:hypothetical protein